MKIKLFLLPFLVFSQSIFAHFDYVGNHRIEGKDSRKFFGSFIWPNEQDANLLSEVLDNANGVLISVGTFRTLFHAVMGNFSRIIMIDMDPSVAEFNVRNVSLIEALGNTGWSLEKQRLIYVALLSLRDFSFNEIDEIIKNSNLNTTKEKITQITQMLVCRGFFKPENKEINATLFKMISDFRKSFTDLDEEEDALREINRLNNDNIEMTYWKTDNAWKKIQDFIRDKKISIVAGDIRGCSLNSINEGLKKLPDVEKLTVLDLSNCPAYWNEENINIIGTRINEFNKDEGFRILVTYLIPEEEKDASNLTKVWNYCFLSSAVFNHWDEMRSQHENSLKSFAEARNLLLKKLNDCVFELIEPNE